MIENERITDIKDLSHDELFVLIDGLLEHLKLIPVGLRYVNKRYDGKMEYEPFHYFSFVKKEEY